MPNYFAYGTNCNPEVMGKKGIPFTSRKRATLEGYRLLFNKKSLRERLPESSGFANITKWTDGVVEGILYEFDSQYLSLLDESERYPDHYDRIEVEVQTEQGATQCWTYQAQPDKTADGLIPSRNYLNHILAGREFLSEQYYAALDQSQTYVADCAVCHQKHEVLFVIEHDQMHTLCQPCRECRIVWGETRGRILTVAETESVMNQLVLSGSGYESIPELIREAISLNLIQS